jgi:hypothetical protein
MTAMPRPSAREPAPAADDLAEHRRCARGVVADFSSQAPSPELPGVFRENSAQRSGTAGVRRPGPVAGLPHAWALVEELVIRNGGAALAVSLHSVGPALPFVRGELNSEVSG